MSIVSRLLRQESPPALSIEPMRRRHLRDVLPIEERCHPKPWTTGVFVSEIELARHGERYYIVARDGHRLVGYGGLLFAPDAAHITNIAVDPLHRRQGVGRALMIDLVETALARGAEAMTLEVRVGNVAAQDMYRKFGFVPAGIRQRYYENSEDALVMWAHDIHGVEFRTRLRSLSVGRGFGL